MKAEPAAAAAPPLSDLWDTVAALPGDTVAWFRQDAADVLVALAVGLGLFLLIRTLRWGLLRALAAANDVTTASGFLHGVVEQTRSLFIAVLSAFLVSRIIALPDAVARVIASAFVIAFAVQGALWLRELVLSLVRRRATAGGDDDAALTSAMGIITVLVNVVVWLLALVLVLDNLGINVTALVAGLGVGGIAIGLAAQGIFSDLFAALAILFDRPFRVGDTIGYGNSVGTVEAIGLKTTRIRALSGEQLVMANTKLLEQQVSNMRRLVERRVVMQFGVTYQTAPDLLERIPGIVRELVEAQPHCRFDRAHFFNFAPSSLDFEFVFFVEVPEYEVMMNARQGVCLGLMRRFAELGVEFAYPTQTVFTAAPDGRRIDPRGRQPTEADAAALGTASPRASGGMPR